MTETEIKTEIKAEPQGNGRHVERPPEELTSKIIEQVDYYFGDINLPRDKFLQDELKKDHGWVKLETMLKFNRLKQLCSDVDQLALVLQDSSIVDVSDDKTKIRRNPEIPLPENSLEYWQEIKNRTVYLKGFPLTTTLDEIKEFMKHHGHICNIVMRRIKGERSFKGSVFITFDDKESALRFVKNADASIFNGNAIEKMMQMDYWAKKTKENKERKEAAKSLKQLKNKESQQDSKKASQVPVYIKGIILRIEGVNIKKIENDIDFKNTIDELKEFFKPYGEVAYIARVEKTDKIDIRFNTTEENTAAKVWDSVVKAIGLSADDGDKVMFYEDVLRAEVLEGKKEQRYWADFTKEKLAKHERSKNRDRRGGVRRCGDRPKGDINKRIHKIFQESDDEDSELVDLQAKKVKEEPSKGSDGVEAEVSEPAPPAKKPKIEEV